MGVRRSRGVHLSPQVYAEILQNSVVDKHVVGGVLFGYSSSNMKAAPRWAELLPYRHLLADLLRHSNGVGILQTSWQAAVTTFVEGRWQLSAQAIETGSYNVRVMLSQLREFRRHSQKVAGRWQSTLQVVVDWVNIDGEQESCVEANEGVIVLPARRPSCVEEFDGGASDSSSSYHLFAGVHFSADEAISVMSSSPPAPVPASPENNAIQDRGRACGNHTPQN